MSHWLGEALKRAREAEPDPDGVIPQTIAAVLKMHERKLARVEGDEGEDAQSYKDIDRIVAGYTYVLGIEDAREIWIDALELWYREGAMPDFSDDLPGARFVRPIRDESRRREQARTSPEERLGAMRSRLATKRATG